MNFNPGDRARIKEDAFETRGGGSYDARNLNGLTGILMRGDGHLGFEFMLDKPHGWACDSPWIPERMLERVTEPQWEITVVTADGQYIRWDDRLGGDRDEMVASLESFRDRSREAGYWGFTDFTGTYNQIELDKVVRLMAAPRGEA